MLLVAHDCMIRMLTIEIFVLILALFLMSYVAKHQLKKLLRYGAGIVTLMMAGLIIFTIVSTTLCSGDSCNGSSGKCMISKKHCGGGEHMFHGEGMMEGKHMCGKGKPKCSNAGEAGHKCSGTCMKKCEKAGEEGHKCTEACMKKCKGMKDTMKEGEKVEAVDSNEVIKETPANE